MGVSGGTGTLTPPRAGGRCRLHAGEMERTRSCNEKTAGDLLRNKTEADVTRQLEKVKDGGVTHAIERVGGWRERERGQVGSEESEGERRRRGASRQAARRDLEITVKRSAGEAHTKAQTHTRKKKAAATEFHKCRCARLKDLDKPLAALPSSPPCSESFASLSASLCLCVCAYSLLRALECTRAVATLSCGTRLHR